MCVGGGGGGARGEGRELSLCGCSAIISSDCT